MACKICTLLVQQARILQNTTNKAVLQTFIGEDDSRVSFVMLSEEEYNSLCAAAGKGNMTYFHEEFSND